jgi:hypothetical protein
VLCVAAENLGILSGNAVDFALSATGVGAVLVASYEVFSVIRWSPTTRAGDVPRPTDPRSVT